MKGYKIMADNSRRERELRRQKARRKQIAILTTLIIIMVVLMVGCISFLIKSNKKNKTTTEAPGSSDLLIEEDLDEIWVDSETGGEIASVTDVVAAKSVNLIAVGDDLVHTGVWRSFETADGGHDYTQMFEHIQPYLDNADIKIINQETIFGGEGTELSSYPVFNSPEEIGDAIAACGFNVVLHATNHAFDMGESGMLNTVKFWREKHPEVTMIGLHETEEEKQEIPVVDYNGIKIALLNYTYNHNWESLSSAAEPHLNTLCTYDPSNRMIDFNTLNPQVIEDIQKAEEQADFTIVFPHWGTEYVFGTTSQQDDFSVQMVEAGADLIIGGHPHVIEPVKWIETENGNRALCYFSLGNFVSTQDSVGGLLGGMASLKIIKDATGTYIDEDSIKAIPLVTDYSFPDYYGGAHVNGTFLLGEYTEEQAAAHGLLPRFGIRITRDELVRISEEMFGEFLSYE